MNEPSLKHPSDVTVAKMNEALRASASLGGPQGLLEMLVHNASVVELPDITLSRALFWTTSTPEDLFLVIEDSQPSTEDRTVMLGVSAPWFDQQAIAEIQRIHSEYSAA